VKGRGANLSQRTSIIPDAALQHPPSLTLLYFRVSLRSFLFYPFEVNKLIRSLAMRRRNRAGFGRFLRAVLSL
jgi:hypothetical protein